MNALKIGIVEDEMVIAEQLRATLEQIGYEVCEPCNTYTEALEMLATETLDLVLLDIQLTGRKTGIDVAHVINEQYRIPFIFLTSNSDTGTVRHASEVNPAAYLVKPFNREDLYTSIEIAVAKHAHTGRSGGQSKEFSEAILIKENHRFFKVRYENITHLSVDHVYVEVHTVGGKKYLVRSSLANFIDKVSSPDFMQVHRSHWINIRHFESMNTHDVVVNGVSLPVSKAYRDEVLARATTF